MRQRVRWWSALALLRSLASSPAAAAATLRNRSAPSESETVAEADELGRRTVLDLMEDESQEGVDVAPGGLTAEDEEHQRERRRLQDMAREAEALYGKPDAKLQKAVKLVKELVEDGFNPIVFCRFIPTAEYVADELRKKLKGVEVAAVTGTLPPAEREERVEELGRHKKRVLVATDCLSEGINLQEHFDAVFHYDLSWNPTRHEQREGRVDRYGQPEDTVRALTYYGIDNQIDGVVLDVLIRKHKQIRNSLGVSVPVPGDTEEVVEAIFEGLLLREESGGDLSARLPGFDEFFAPKKEDLYNRWESVGDREKRSRTMFAQESVKTEDVARELQAVRAAIGSGEEVEHFAKTAFQAYHAVVSENGNVKIDLSEVPRAVKDAIGANGTERITAKFELPVKDGEVYLSRTHPIIEGLASHVMDTALDPLGESEARRCGVTVTSQVERRTTLLLVRYRYHIITRYPDGDERALLAEDCQLAAFAGAATDPQWLGSEDAEALLTGETGGQRPPGPGRVLPQAGHSAGRRAQGEARRRRPRARGGAARGPQARAAGLQADRSALPGGAEPPAGRARRLRLPPEAGLGGRREDAFQGRLHHDQDGRPDPPSRPPHPHSRAGQGPRRPRPRLLPPRRPDHKRGHKPLVDRPPGRVVRLQGPARRPPRGTARDADDPRAVAPAPVPGAGLRAARDHAGRRDRGQELPHLPPLAARPDPPRRLPHRPRQTHPGRGRRGPHQPARPRPGVR